MQINSLIINNVKKFFEENNLKGEVNSFLSFYDELRDSKLVTDIYEKLYVWLNKNFDVSLLEIRLVSIKTNEEEKVFLSSDDTYTYFKTFETKLNDDLIIIFKLYFEEKISYENAIDKDDYLNTVFYMIAPTISSISFQEMVKEMSIKDSATNSYNRKFLIEHLNKLLPLARREQRHISFLMVGIDHFKAVIDEFDYQIGDKLLLNLADILRENLRVSDIVARLDADQFFVALAGVTNKEDAMYVANKLIENFAKSSIVVNPKGQTLSKTICIGVTHYDYQSNIDDIIRFADISLYEARNIGRSIAKEYNRGQDDEVDLF